MVKHLLFCWFWTVSAVGFTQTITHTWKAVAGSTDWNTASNWSPASVPGSGSNVLIGASNFQPRLSGNVTVNHLKLDYSAIGLNLGSYTLTLTQSLFADHSLIVSNGGKLVSPLVSRFLGCTVQGTVTLELDAGVMNGGNTFQNDLTLRVNSPIGSSFLMAWVQRDVYQGNVTLINNGQGGVHLAAYAATGSAPTTFEGNFTFINNTGSPNYLAENATAGTLLFKGAVSIEDNTTDPNSFIRILKSEFQKPVSLLSKAANISFAGAVVLKDNLSLNGQGGSFAFSQEASLSTKVIVAHPATIQVGGSGFSSGSINLDWLDYQSGSDLNLLLGDGNTHTGVLTAIKTTANAVFSGKVNLRADYMEFNGSTFQSAVSVERTGPNIGAGAYWNGGGNSSGGNTFHAPLTVINHSNTGWKWGTLATDVFNANVTLIHGRGSASKLYLAQTGHHQFKGNLTLQSTSDAVASGGIQVGHASDTTELAVGKLITGTGFLSGQIKLYRFHQRGFSTPQTLTLPQAAALTLEQAVFESSLYTTTGHLALNNSIFYRYSTFTKTAAGTDYNNGDNLFYRHCKFSNQAPAGSNLQFVAPNSVIR
ncbi:hypothetical protein [Runella slithyformis]|uniref:G8 domain-containing protein n=1 Tax=Runella slithyformis (strain ATCC 29530 / DSM 19594 / LMG 11500 / NCIMB 11436 / LSU 4) TaxID=761193 RepID=A0A7U4E904_RUNSL|nr:hypothetical protein [Runella slithyformis]AEI52173.1 hypothetical protein Runsl_5877 [Runella slithyformis DSM 19594]